MRTLALFLVLAAGTVHAEPPSAEQMAKLQHDIQQATDDVDKKYAGKELSADERKQQIKDRAAAENAVLDKAGVDKKEYARAGAKMSKEDRATAASEKEKLDAKDKAAAGAKGGQTEVIVEKGGGNGQQLTPEEEAAAIDKAKGFDKGAGGSSKGKSGRGKK
ncbi:MAG: hypothetical protein IPJ65_22815 [Archangiaceae bacterium]|nr:hypothetical protein [Archangiaceae bacterium]